MMMMMMTTYQTLRWVFLRQFKAKLLRISTDSTHRQVWTLIVVYNMVTRNLRHMGCSSSILDEGN